MLTDFLTDYCIVGLGNPGLKYFNTRHNTGFLVIDKLAEFFKIKSFDLPLPRGGQGWGSDSFQAASVNYKEKNLVLMKPLTYMNSSGRAVKHIAEILNLTSDKFLVIYDDVNLDFGTLRLRPSGSDGGQNGIASIIYEMETEEIPRLRIGIKNDSELEKLKIYDGINLADFVLSPFTNDESKNLDKVIDAAKDAVLCYIDDGIDAAMNSFNRNVIE